MDQPGTHRPGRIVSADVVGIVETLGVASALVRVARVADVTLTVTPGRIEVQLPGDRSLWVDVASALGLHDVGRDYPRRASAAPCPEFSTVIGTWRSCTIVIFRPLRHELERVAS